MASVVAAWPAVALGEVMQQRKKFIQIDDTLEYKRCRVQLHAQGVVLRDIVIGAEVKTKAQQVCQPGEFLVAEIDAKVGGYGIVPPALVGAIVSSHYFLFVLNETLLDKRYLGYYVRTPSFQEQVQAQGSTNYAAVRPQDVLNYTIPLPPLDEQQRIVARIEELVARIEEARGLRREAASELDMLVVSEEMRVWPREDLLTAPTLNDVTLYLSRGRQSAQGESDIYLIKTQHVQQGMYVPTRLTLAPHAAVKISNEALVQTQDILIACSAAGCLGRVAKYMGAGRLATTDTHVAIARPNPGVIMPEYLYAYLRGAQGQVQLRSRERGDWTKEKIGFRLLELNLADLKRVPVPLPSLAEQRDIVVYLSKLQASVDAAKALHSETSTVLDAVLPSVLNRAFRGEL